MKKLLIAMVGWFALLTTVFALPVSAVPDAPTNVVAVATSPTSASVSFDLVGDDGNPPITYDVVSSPGGLTGTGAGSPIEVTGLSPDTAYQFTVTATSNEPAVSPASAPSNSITTPDDIPGQPGTPTAVATGTTTAQVTFTAPADDGGAPPLTYEVTSEPAGGSGTGVGTTITVTGLSPATAYQFRVTATNQVPQSGPASVLSNQITTDGLPPAVPGPARDVAAVLQGGDGITVSWQAPNTGGPVDDYRVTLDSNPATELITTNLLVTFENLDPGTYQATVVARNVSGSGPERDSGNVEVPDVPGVPSVTGATLSGTAAASVTFAPPGDNGGSPITGYVVTAVPDGGGDNVTETGGGSPITVTGLAAGTTYRFRVRATNVAGDGPNSALSQASVTTPSGPGVPADPITATLVGTSAASVSFGPAAPNGSAIVSYTVTASPGGRSVVGAQSPLTVTGLDEDTSYTFTVTATNAVGTSGASSASNAVATPGRPAAPSAVSASLNSPTSASVTFEAPDANGSAITEYTVTASADGAPDVTASAATSPIVVTGLQLGATYTFTVRATNSVGPGPASAASTSLFVPDVPGLPVITSAENVTPYSSTVVIDWEAPSDSGGSPVTGYIVTVGDEVKELGASERSATFSGVDVGKHTPSVVAVTAAGPGGVATGPEIEVRGFPPFTSEEAFIRQLYRDFLGREADASGLAYWTGVTADDGSNISAIARSFMFSAEFAPRRSITRLYLAFFDRRPDPGGFDFWTDRINTGQANLNTISNAFVLSPEFQSTYGSLSDRDFVRLVYNNVLLRAPDQAGLDFWLTQMAAGMTRGEVMTNFSESPEFEAATRPAVDVIMTYRGMLDRQADDDGFRFWLGRIAGDPDAVNSLIRGFYFSDEYAERVTP